ncbi:MAG TPA: hypothetical protein VGL02_19450, partial [Streptomyces sp.]
HVDRLRTGAVRTALGDITALALDGDVFLETEAGDVRAHLTGSAQLRVRTGLGDIEVTAADGITVDRSDLHTGCGAIQTD